ncbi:MAG: metallophosphoesterase [Clostridia bacterium]|nr:metallophosphoesterase [Clostridia bacterium]
MRIGVVSDSHGKIFFLKRALDAMPKVDKLIHLGDHYSDIQSLNTRKYKDIILIKGNCDFGYDASDEEILHVEGNKIFVTHGHKYRIKWGEQLIVYKALEIQADIVLYGHTHIPQIFYNGTTVFINPGSVSEPRFSNQGTFAIIEIKKGKVIPSIIKLGEL